MRKSRTVLAAVVGAPVLLVSGSALALDVTFEQASGLAGGAALGAVGGPVGGFIGGMLGRAIGRTIHHAPPPVDLTDLKSRPRVTAINQGPFINAAVEDRAVDSTPIRTIEVRPTEMDAQTYMASARGDADAPRTYLASAQSRGPQAAAAQAMPVSAAASDSANGQPGTLDYQLNQLNARRAAEGQPRIEQIADFR